MVQVRPVVICGGGGTRLWPLSTSQLPKQFLPIISDKSMLEETFARLNDTDLFAEPWAIGSARHRGALNQCLPAEDTVFEPVGRNSAPAIAIAALRASPDELLLILPADHHIGDVPAFHAAVRQAIGAAAAGNIVTFGITPDFPATGYGYIEAGESDGLAEPALRVQQFVEKPDQKTAEDYIATGRYYWNAGMFLFKARDMLAAFERHAPDILASVRSAYRPDGTLDRSAFLATRAESIDYAVMEKSSNIAVVPVAMQWSDVGDYRAVHALRARASASEAVTKGPVAAPGMRRGLVHSSGPSVAVHGLDDVAIVATPQSVLVTRLQEAADIKPAVEAIAAWPQSCLQPQQRTLLAKYLWQEVLPHWAKHALDPVSGGAVECLDLAGQPMPGTPRRGRVAPRQLYAFARAKGLGWDPNGAASVVIEHLCRYLDGPARAQQGGWNHVMGADGQALETCRDLYDHAFVALAGAELAALGDMRGTALAEEAFATIDTLFADPLHGGWADTETKQHAGKLSNPHMHLLEASLRHYEVTAEPSSLARIGAIAALFEGHMFAPEHDCLMETFNTDWSRTPQQVIEPGHCYEWAFLMTEVQRLTGRDCASWLRRLTHFADTHGVVSGLVCDVMDAPGVSYRLWPQLERLRAHVTLGLDRLAVQQMCDGIWNKYLSQGPRAGWVDQLDASQTSVSTAVPASMVYHLMTSLAPFIDPPSAVD
ncbi:MAG: AGE family epimerase/isomerase [Pseudomonadota bacterium]